MNKVISAKVIAYVFAALACCGCGQSGYKISLEDSFKSSIANDTLHWELINVGKEWDSVYIVKPYSDISGIGIEMNESVRAAIDHLTQFDSDCTLLFIRDNSLVAYSTVPRGVIDFCQVKETNYARHSMCVIVRGALSN